MTGDDTVRVDGVSKRLGRTLALDDVSLTLGRGVVGVLGPNGAGKSTLLRLIATVTAPDRGRVAVGGLDAASRPGRVAIRRRLGYLPQEVVLAKGFSVVQLVDYVAILKEVTDRRQRRDAVEHAVHAVGLTDVSNRSIGTLSGGQRRRVALAAAIVGTPTLVVLDEPLAALDPDERDRITGVLQECGRTGTVIVSTHHPDEAAGFCDRLAVLATGRLVFDGTPNDLAARASGIGGDGSPHDGYRYVVATSTGAHP
jgi:ABC-2 type transport system ATP-binding protein